MLDKPQSSYASYDLESEIYEAVEEFDDFEDVGDISELFEGNPERLSFSIPMPSVDEMVDGRYRVAQVLDGQRLIVEHTGVQKRFTMAMAPTMAPGSVDEERLRAVAQASGLIGHEHLGFITDFGFCSRFGAYIVSELVEGMTLTDVLGSAQQHALDEVLEFALQVGGALAALHEVGLAHGLLETGDFVCRDHRWKIMGAGVTTSPDKFDPYLAPEVFQYTNVTPRSDQYAFASYLYHLLVGEAPEGDDPFEPSALRADVPPDVDAAILKARSRVPNDRWRSMDDLLAALQAAFKVWHEPTVDPFDAREASRVQRASAVAIETPFARTPTRQSMVVTVALQPGKTQLHVSFSSAARLRREYRRNILARGLFVPMREPPEPPTDVVVEVEYQPRGESIEVVGTVLNRVAAGKESPAGAGIVFDELNHTKLMDFVRGLSLGLGIGPEDQLEMLGELREDADVTAGEAFVYSRLVAGPMRVADARSALAGLPFDFDEAVTKLVDAGLIKVESVEPSREVIELEERPNLTVERDTATPIYGVAAVHMVERPEKKKPQKEPPSSSFKNQKRARSGAFRPDDFDSSGSIRENFAEVSVAEDRIKLSQDDTERVLESVAFFEERQNYLSAVETLRRALKHAPKEPRLHERMARVRADFFGDITGAFRSIGRALNQDPKNADYQATKRYLETLRETRMLDPIQVLKVPAGAQSLVRYDPEIYRLWIEVVNLDGRGVRRLLSIDLERLAIHATTDAEHPANTSVVPGNHTRLAAFDERVPTAQKVVRKRRQKMLTTARSARDFGPWFRVGPYPVAWSQNSSYLVFAEHPETGARGHYLSYELNEETAPLLLEGDDVEQVCFSPDDTWIAWVDATDSTIWGAKPLQAKRAWGEFEGGVSIAWSNNSVLAVGHARGDIRAISVSGESEVVLAGKGLPENVEKVVFSCDMHAAVAIAPAAGGDSVIGLRLKGGACWLKPVVVGDAILQAVVREDLTAVLAHENGFTVVDLRSGKKRRIFHSRLTEGALSNTTWRAGQPLVVTAEGRQRIEIFRFEPTRFF